MEGQSIGPCPHCHSHLEPGHVCFGSVLLWNRHRLNWWQRFIFQAYPYRQFVDGSLLTTPWFGSRSGHRCTSCGAVIIPADR
jgi:hypothetical protein